MLSENIFSPIAKRLSLDPRVCYPPLEQIPDNIDQEWQWYKNGELIKEDIQSFIGVNQKRSIVWGYGKYQNFIGPAFGEIDGGGVIRVYYALINNDQTRDLIVGLVPQNRFGMDFQEFPGGYIDPGKTAIESGDEEDLEEAGLSRGNLTVISLNEKCPGFTSAYRGIARDKPGITAYAVELPESAFELSTYPYVLQPIAHLVAGNRLIRFYRFRELVHLLRGSDHFGVAMLLLDYLIEQGKCSIKF